MHTAYLPPAFTQGRLVRVPSRATVEIFTRIFIEIPTKQKLDKITVLHRAVLEFAPLIQGWSNTRDTGDTSPQFFGR